MKSGKETIDIFNKKFFKILNKKIFIRMLDIKNFTNKSFSNLDENTYKNIISDFILEIYLKSFKYAADLFYKYLMPENIVYHSICVSIVMLYLIFNFKYDEKITLRKVRKFYTNIYKNEDRDKINKYSKIMLNQLKNIYLLRNDFFNYLIFCLFHDDIKEKVKNILKNFSIFKLFLTKMINASLLHDTGKIFEIKKDLNDYNKILENVIKIHYFNHADIGFNILKNEGDFYEAFCTKYHLIDGFLKVNQSFPVLIINLSDKMVKHKFCVLLKVRFKDLIERYPQFKKKFNKKNFKIYTSFLNVLGIEKKELKIFFTFVNNWIK